jgi:hypothetical protein
VHRGIVLAVMAQFTEEWAQQQVERLRAIAEAKVRSGARGPACSMGSHWDALSGQFSPFRFARANAGTTTAAAAVAATSSREFAL